MNFVELRKAKFVLPHSPAPEGMLCEVAIIRAGIISVLCI
jgi:hypothetical protein